MCNPSGWFLLDDGIVVFDHLGGVLVVMAFVLDLGGDCANYWMEVDMKNVSGFNTEESPTVRLCISGAFYMTSPFPVFHWLLVAGGVECQVRSFVLQC